MNLLPPTRLVLILLFFSDDDFVAGVRALGEPSIHLPFELLVEATQLQLSATLAAAAPNTTFNLNHLG